MQNVALARAFDEIADYMELAGENQFKIRAYRRASEVVADFPSPIEDAADNGQLDEIEGLGAATVAKSREFLATGQIKLLLWLQSKYPPGLLDVLRVPGLGPKKVALLHKERGVDSIEKFSEILENGGLSGVAGFGPKTIENLKTGLKRMAQLTARLPLTEAAPIATKLKSALHEKRPEIEVFDAGSLRRGADTLGNLNFVARTNDTRFLDDFLSLPHVLETLERTETSAKAKIYPGLEVEIVLSKPENFGSTLWFQTGSRAHLESASEVGDFASETELYASLKFDFIPPELREGRGEWAAAKAGRLPKLIEIGDIRGDLHTHSTWSDGVSTIAQMASEMSALGYEYFAVTDHSKALAMANGLNAARLREQALEIAEVQAQFPNVKIFRGIECDILRDGTMDLDDEILADLDVVVASVHSAFNLDAVAQTDRIIRAISHPSVTFVGHPTGRVLGVRPPYDVDIPALIEAAKHFGKALEINASERLDLKDEHAFAAREAGVLLSIDTDAHSPKMLSNLPYGITTARRAWCEAKDVLNTKPLDALQLWLSRKQI
ncbi:MAG TPA: DNA polymerase/3'-5' exonuclease PolX [Abditibacterium sp.]